MKRYRRSREKTNILQTTAPESPEHIHKPDHELDEDRERDGRYDMEGYEGKELDSRVLSLLKDGRIDDAQAILAHFVPSADFYDSPRFKEAIRAGAQRLVETHQWTELKTMRDAYPDVFEAHRAELQEQAQNEVGNLLTQGYFLSTYEAGEIFDLTSFRSSDKYKAAAQTGVELLASRKDWRLIARIFAENPTLQEITPKERLLTTPIEVFVSDSVNMFEESYRGLLMDSYNDMMRDKLRPILDIATELEVDNNDLRDSLLVALYKNANAFGARNHIMGLFDKMIGKEGYSDKDYQHEYQIVLPLFIEALEDGRYLEAAELIDPFTDERLADHKDLVRTAIQNLREEDKHDHANALAEIIGEYAGEDRTTIGAKQHREKWDGKSS